METGETYDINDSVYLLFCRGRDGDERFYWREYLSELNVEESEVLQQIRVARKHAQSMDYIYGVHVGVSLWGSAVKDIQTDSHFAITIST
jgi:hypothetical protein